MTTYITNVSIIDGSGAPAFDGSLLIENDKIVKVLKSYDTVLASNSDRIIDGENMTLAPGFIDTHSHSDLKVLSEPDLLPKLHLLPKYV